jgi:1-phosphofructokinase family hexose kinase
MDASARGVDSSLASANPPGILTVTLNAAVDKTYTVPEFVLGQVHRLTEMRITAGGKGINVARVYRALGGSAIAAGFLGGAHGELILRHLRKEGIDAEFVPVAGESRACMAIVDYSSGAITELNESGPAVTKEDCDRLLGRLRELLPGRAAVILSGSIPPGTPTTIYRDIILLAQEGFGVPAVLDTSGAALTYGVQAQPFLVKPNQFELAALGIACEDWRQAPETLRQRYGVRMALVTAGAQGAVLGTEKGIWQAVAPPVHCFSTVGSGDSLTAGFLWSYLRGSPGPEALRLGVAAGAANVMTYSAGFLESQQVFHLGGRTMLTRLT